MDANYVASEIRKGRPLKEIREELIGRGIPEDEADRILKEGMEKAFQRKGVSPVIILGSLILVLAVLSFFLLQPTEHREPTTVPASEPLIHQPSQESPSVLHLEDCGEDASCFMRHAEDCSPSRFLHVFRMSIFGMNQTSETYLEIKGKEGDRCLVFVEQGRVELEFPPDTPQEIVDEQTALYKKLEGRNGTCLFTPEGLIGMVERWENGTYSTSDWDGWNCTGDFFDPYYLSR